MNELELRQRFPTATRLLYICRGALRRLRPHVLDNDAHRHVEDMKNTNEAFRRMGGTEHARIQREVHSEQSKVRRHAASVALHHLRQAEQHVYDWRRYVKETRQNVSISFPEALNHVSADGMITLALLRERRRTSVMKMTAAQMLDSYLRTFATKDAAALTDAQLIEEIVQGGIGLALEPEDLSTLRKLREHIDGIQELRVPHDLPPFAELNTDIESMHQRAGVLQLEGINPEFDPAAATAFKLQESTLLEIGTRSDRDDLAAVQQELAKASGQ